MVQALPTVEYNVSIKIKYYMSVIITGYIYTIDVRYNDELKQKTKKYTLFPKIQKLMLNSFQIIKMKTKGKDRNQMKSSC